MKALTDMVLTKDRKRIVPIGDPDGDSFAWVASKGEEIPESLVLDKQAKPKASITPEEQARKDAKADIKIRTPKENK